jgi:hypothetical protein
LSHILTGEQGTGRGPFVSQNNPRGDGSRFASEPVPAQQPEDHTSTGAQQRSKQVAE